MKPHPLCKIFPELKGADFAALVADIKANGLQNPIIVYEHKILDGRNRYNACVSCGIEPQFEDYTGDDPMAFVISQNLNRRHLTDDQRAAIAAELATQKGLGIADSARDADEKAAKALNVTGRQVQKAKQLERENPSAFNQVKNGKKSLNAAHEAKHPRRQKPAPAQEPEPEEDPPHIVQHVPEPPEQAAPVRAVEPEPKVTPEVFVTMLSGWEQRINAACAGNQREREKFGRHAAVLATRLMNQVRSVFNPYTR